MTPTKDCKDPGSENVITIGMHARDRIAVCMPLIMQYIDSLNAITVGYVSIDSIVEYDAEHQNLICITANVANAALPRGDQETVQQWLESIGLAINLDEAPSEGLFEVECNDPGRYAVRVFSLDVSISCSICSDDTSMATLSVY